LVTDFTIGIKGKRYSGDSMVGLLPRAFYQYSSTCSEQR
jgi:hypothetical protein